MTNKRPTGMRITRPYATEEEFIQGDGLAIGRMGMILIGAPERPPGITVRFEIVLEDGTTVFRGEGRVVARRVNPNGREGLEVRFTRLDSHSKALVQRVLELRKQGKLVPKRSLRRPSKPKHESAKQESKPKPMEGKGKQAGGEQPKTEQLEQKPGKDQGAKRRGTEERAAKESSKQEPAQLQAKAPPEPEIQDVEVEKEEGSQLLSVPAPGEESEETVPITLSPRQLDQEQQAQGGKDEIVPDTQPSAGEQRRNSEEEPGRDEEQKAAEEAAGNEKEEEELAAERQQVSSEKDAASGVEKSEQRASGEGPAKAEAGESEEKQPGSAKDKQVEDAGAQEGGNETEKLLELLRKRQARFERPQDRDAALKRLRSRVQSSKELGA